MLAGRLRERITIQAPTDTNTQGSVSTTWADHSTRWAEVRPARGMERFSFGSDRRQAVQEWRITTRMMTSITTLMRVSWKGRFLGVQAVTHDYHKEITTLDCEEIEA